MQADTASPATPMEKNMRQSVDNDLPQKEQEMLSVSTSRFGEVKVDPDKIITMTSPFLGFPDSRRFILIPHGEDTPFMWLQSLDDSQLAFVLIPALILIADYQPEITKQVRLELKAEEKKELTIFLLLTIPKNNPLKMTANLLGPLVINPEQLLAKQVVLDARKWDPRWPVFIDDGK